MPVQIADFWKLAVASGALSMERCKALHAAFQKQRGASGPATANELATWLVAEDVLTRYQAIVFLSGRPGPFVFGDYRVFDRIETGRLAGLLRAVQVTSGQRALLHVFKGRAAQDPAAWKEVIALARLAARARHEHLSQLHCLVEAGSQKIAVLADLDGRAVAEQYAAARVNAADAARIVSQAAAGLAALHELGIVHGALCPANLWLEPSGSVRLLQFPLSGETQPSAAQGTAKGPYSAPELAIPGQPLDGQSDVYSLGCVFYELLTGQPRAATPIGAAGQTLAGVVESLEKLAAVPRPLAEIVARMIDADRQLRYPSAAAVVQALAAVAREPAGAGPAKPRPLQPILVRQPAAGALLEAQPAEGPYSFNLADLSDTDARKKGWRERGMVASTIGALAIVIAALLYFAFRPGGGVSEHAAIGVEGSAAPKPPGSAAPSPENRPAAEKKTAAEPAADPKQAPAVDRHKIVKPAVELVDDDGESLWASPTDGQPLGLKYLPAGAELYLALRPADILAHAEGKKIVDALGPGGAWGKSRLEAITGMPMSDVSQLIVACYTPQGSLPTVALVVRTPGELDEKTMRDKWGDPNPVEASGQKYFAAGEWAYFLPANGDHHVLAIAPPAQMPDVVAAAAAALEPEEKSAAPNDDGPPLNRQMEKLLKTTDRDRQVTLLAEPHALLMSGESILAGNLIRLHDSLVWFFGDDAAAVALSFHFGDDFFAELRAINSADQDPYRLTEHFKRRLETLPERVEEYLVTLNPHRYGKLILGRMTEMVRLVRDYSRIDAENQQAVVRCYLPGIAAHNLAMGVELALAERPGAAVASGPVAKKPVAAAEALKQKISLSFDKDTLEKTMDMLSKEIDTEIVILGSDLQLDGITKNQSFALNERDKPAGEILRIVMLKANPDGKLVYVIRQKHPNGKEGIFITTRGAAAKRGEKLPAELEAEPGPKK